jgi:hypothetical protein
MLGEPEKQFSVTRTAPSTSGRAKIKFLSSSLLEKCSTFDTCIAMKGMLLLATLLISTSASFGQGQVEFRNWSNQFTPPPSVDAPIFLGVVGGTRLDSNVSTLYRAALLGGPTTGTPAVLDFAHHIFDPGNLSMTYSDFISTRSWAGFRTGSNTHFGAGYINVGSTGRRVIPGVDWNQFALVQVVAWQGDFADWSSAFLAAETDSNVLVGVSNPLILQLPSSVTDTYVTWLLGLESFAISSIPEPSALALVCLATLAALMYRRASA